MSERQISDVSILAPVSWVAYASFYLCRGNLGVLMPVLARDRFFSTGKVSILLFGFSIAYCLGQFVLGRLVDLLGAHRVVAAGMFCSACVTAAFAYSSKFSSMFWLISLNGIAQSAGWSGAMRLYRVGMPTSTDMTIGWWSTNYVAGALAGKLFASFALGSVFIALPFSLQLSNGGEVWRRAAILPAIALAIMSLLFGVLTRSLPDRKDQETSRTASMPRISTSTSPWLNALTPRVALISIAYFFVKMIRYSLLFWLPLYFATSLGTLPAHSGYASSWFELCGIAGVLFAVFVSTKLFAGRRFPVAIGSMGVLAVTCAAMAYVRISHTTAASMLTACLGLTTFSADSILVGAATQDAASPSQIGTVAGIVDGAGSAGQVLSPLAVGAIAASFGWPAVFIMLATIASLSALILLWGRRFEFQPAGTLQRLG